jgi:hypothetical protein
LLRPNVLAILRSEPVDDRRGRRRREPALVLGEVEFPVGLELGRLLHLARGLVAQGHDHFVVRDRDAVLLVLLLEHGLLDELLPDLVPDLLDVLETHPSGVGPLALLDRLLDDGLVVAEVHRLAVDLSDRRPREQVVVAAIEQAAQLHDEQEHEEAEDDCGDLGGDTANGLHHRRDRALVVGTGEKEA